MYSSAGISGEACSWYEVEGEPTHAVNIPCRDEQMDDYVQTVFHSYPAVLVGMPASPLRERVLQLDPRGGGHGAHGQFRFYGVSPADCGDPGRAVVFRSFCEYLASNRDVWCAPCIEIANYYKAVMEGNDDAH